MGKVIWKPIIGYEGFYEVSSTGEVKSLDKYVYRGDKVHCFMPGRILKKTKKTTGYYKIELQIKNERRTFSIHRLVALAFLEKKEGKNLINHIDGNKLNNHFENLEWCDHTDNINHAYVSGLREWSLRGYEDEILKIFKESVSVTCNSISKKIGVGDGRTIKNLLINNGITEEEINKKRKKVPYEVLVKEFSNKTRNIDICKKYNLSTTTVKLYKKQWRSGIEK